MLCCSCLVGSHTELYSRQRWSLQASTAVLTFPVAVLLRAGHVVTRFDCSGSKCVGTNQTMVITVGLVAIPSHKPG